MVSIDGGRFRSRERLGVGGRRGSGGLKLATSAARGLSAAIDHHLHRLVEPDTAVDRELVLLRGP